MERRLTAILAADVAGYTRLMRANEDGTLAQLKALRTELVDPKIAAYRGRLVKLMGDGMLVEFHSVVDAVRCAAELQRAIARRNADVADVADGGRLEFRMGVNLGDVIIDGEDIYGDGVNVAARLEGLAKPGGLSISEAVYEQIRDRVDLRFEDAGEREVKNIDRPLRVWHWLPARSHPGAASEGTKTGRNMPAIAVLPFTNMSADPEQEYFSDGLTEDIITALTYWRSFPVIARNSCFAYKNQAVDIIQVGRTLGARYVLEGSVRKGNTRIRVTAQLIDSESGHHVWAERYDRELDDIFEVQDDIVQRIAAIVAPELAKAEASRTTGKRAEDLDAWDLCMQAMPLIRERTRESNAQARELFLRAIAIRPGYADAHAGLAMSYHHEILMGLAEDREATVARAMEAAQRAIACDEASSWAHHELSTAYQLLDRVEDALEEARVAVELNPNDAYALHALGNKSDLAGDPGGIELMEKAQGLNPEDARWHNHLAYLARAYVNAGDYEAAAARARQALRRRPDYTPAHYILAIALAYLGRLDEALAELIRCDELVPGFVESRRDWRPYKDSESNRRLRDGLRLLESHAGDR